MLNRVEFDLGDTFLPQEGRVVSVTPLGRPELPWDDSYAEEVFRGEHPLSGSSGGLPPSFRLVVLKRVDGVPVAVATFEKIGHVVGVEFLDAELRTELKYVFTDHAQELTLSPDGVQRPGELFFAHVISIGYGEGKNRYGRPVTRKQIQRGYSNMGYTSVNVEIDDPDRPYSGSLREDIDVSGDGFWEPVATFGDWERWFVKDRPGVKLFD